ncbi:MAG: LLM class flavin-dependent oxidoreductase [Pseudomonadales bacterium]|nr:LLM class flavin-dependent oxidoreductase [Pseudomonadales bacterium]MCP5184963.1 LLM class flavin-dependent oxidoreductase [Pseudomonadales bacterium]
MRFSTSLPRFFDPVDRVPLRRSYRYAQLLEQLGFYAGYVGHHSFTPETGDPSAPFAYLSAIAAQTETLMLGSGIYLGTLHHAVAVCEQVSTLDQISGGRAILGLAAGYREYEFEGYGIPYHQRGERLNEIIEVCRKAWTTGRYDYHGRHFSIPDLPVHPMPRQQGGPRIMIGGTSKAAIERAARQGDGWFTLPMETLAVVERLASQYREACARYGRTPYICLLREVWVAPTVADVERDWLEGALGFHKYYWETGTQGDAHDPVLQRVGNGERVDYETFARDRAIAGTPDFCVEQLERWRDAIGFDEINLIAMTGQHGGNARVPLEAMFTLFAHEVMSRFRQPAYPRKSFDTHTIKENDP